MKRPGSLTFQQKFSLGVFVLIAGATFVFGALRLRKNIILPLFRPENYYTIKTAEQLEAERLQELQDQDTDGDGVSDYEELYVFRTSPFLEDSDSDDIPDGVEIAQQTDPNCPRGRSCGETSQRNVSADGSLSSGSATGSDGQDATDAFGDGAQADGSLTTPSEEEIAAIIIETFGDPTALTPEVIAQRLAEMSPDELREFLGKFGIPRNVLDQTDDETLRTLLQETLTEMAEEGLGTQ